MEAQDRGPRDASANKDIKKGKAAFQQGCSGVYCSVLGFNMFFLFLLEVANKTPGPAEPPQDPN